MCRARTAPRARYGALDKFFLTEPKMCRPAQRRRRGERRACVLAIWVRLTSLGASRGSYLSIDDLRYIVTSDGNPLSGQDLEEFLQEADIFKNGVVVRLRVCVCVFVRHADAGRCARACRTTRRLRSCC